MKSIERFASGRTLSAIVILLSVLLSVPAAAQGSQGQNAVCTTGPNCSPTIGTSAFIDASMFAFQNGTICSVIYNILNGTHYSAAVIDARGLPGSTPATSTTCAAGTTPWYNGTAYVSSPSNILLPAGTIVIPTGWTLPPNTHLFGQGDNPSSGTVIQAGTSFSGTAAMIQFGSSPCLTSGCPGISVEKLILDGQGRQSAGSYISGIVTRPPFSAMSIMSACTKSWGRGCRSQAAPAIPGRTRTSTSTRVATREFPTQCA